MQQSVLKLDAGPATIMPLVHVPLLKQAPQRDGEYKTLLDMGLDLCHFYGDFSGFHIYFIASAYRQRIVADSLDYVDPANGVFHVTLAVTKDDGKEETVRVECKAPLVTPTLAGLRFPERISIAHFSPGTPDALRFHFDGAEAKFKFANNLVPFVPATQRATPAGLFNLNIEYIGKAVGTDGAREVADRLGNGHSTESAIANLFNHKKTNRELFAILYKPGRLTSDTGKPETAMSFELIIDALEKALIGIFQPAFNKQSLNFPNDSSETVHRLAQCGVAQLEIEIASPEDHGLIYSQDMVDPIARMTRRMRIQV
ncbi:hypothetical protein [Massilia sp. CCM 8734]|uniref:hypothetical protein n=1 Tax=Massilia sp. CCM 8734 TaxID=2609283 RepID=UPI00142493DD|nr:hypothetical protein [Massilia sp. CCM 8734]NHZ97605.1 hypothetical protein [Massilia sp. CCM 8734]